MRQPGTFLVPFLLLPALALGQAPSITTVSPRANAQAAERTSPVSITFTHPLLPTAAAALHVFSAQRGGLRTRSTTPAIVSGNTLSFTPGRYPFLPGETVYSTVSTAAASSTGSLVSSRVMQFTTAVSGPGRGLFQRGSDPVVGTAPHDVAVGDVDGDGDLDLVAVMETSNSVFVRLNGGNASGSNTGSFSNGASVPVGRAPQNAVLGDVDGDGDLDLVVANTGSNTVSVRLNGGDGDGPNPTTGTFRNGSEVGVGNAPVSVALGDVDGDGDLDLLVANQGNGSTSGGSSSQSVSVRLNGGDAKGSNTGFFSYGSEVSIGYYPQGVVLGDVDGDGDLDFVTANYNLSGSGTVSVRLNGGDALGTATGRFSNGSEVAVADAPLHAVLADVDGDYDLDLLVAGYAGSTVSVRLNGGNATGSNTGRFSNGSEVEVGKSPLRVAMGDVDSDGDLDMLVTTFTSTQVKVYLNGGNATGTGTGVFGGGSTVPVGEYPYGLALGDVDGDNDLDVVVANYSGSTVSVRLNGGTQPLATLADLAGQPPGLVVTPTVGTGPAPHYFYSGPPLPREATLTMYTLRGQRVWEQAVGGLATGELPVYGLAMGWYLVRLQTATGSYITRFFQP